MDRSTSWLAVSALALVCLAQSALNPLEAQAGTAQAGSTTAAESRAAQIEAWQSIFSDTTRVNVVNVDVVVTGSDGAPVADLTAGDFELLEDGKPVEISNFFAVSNGEHTAIAYAEQEAPGSEGAEPALPADERKLHLIVYVDNANIAAINRGLVFSRLRDFLLANWREDTQVMLISNDRSLVVRQGFTSVPHDMFAALNELEGDAVVGPRFDLDRQSIIRAIEAVNVEEGSGLFGTKPQGAGSDFELGDDAPAGQNQDEVTDRIATDAAGVLPQIRAYSQQIFQHVQATLGILGQFVDTAAGLPGRKSVLYVSDGLPLRPGAGLYEAYSLRFNSLGSVGADVHFGAEGSRDDATNAFQKLIAHANASRVTFYTLDASPPAASEHGSAATAASSGGNFASWNDGLGSAEERDSQDSLVLLAQGTGGRFGLSSSAFDAVLQGVLTDFDNYYSLGYAADPKADGQRRDIKVRLRQKRKGAEIRYRSSFRDKSLQEQAVEQTQSALLLGGQANPLGIALEPREMVAQDDGSFVVPLLVKVPLGNLVLVPGEKAHRAKISMFVAVRDEKGRTSAVNQHICPIQIPNEEMLTALGKQGACGVRLLMREGSQRLAVSLLDEVASISSTASLDLEVGSEPPRETASLGPGPAGASR